MFGTPGHFFLTSRVPGPASNDCSMVVWSLDNLLALTTLTGKVVTKTGAARPRWRRGNPVRRRRC